MTFNIIFYGGYGATRNDVDAWRHSVVEQVVDAYVSAADWPKGASASNPLATYRSCADDAKRIDLNRGITYIVGHSSGCAIANEVASLVIDQAKIRLVCLDGFVPYKNQRDLPTTQIWSAMHNGFRSLNYDALKGNKNFHVYDPPHCTRKWSLHFSLVNENSTDKTVTDILKGYVNCKANLCWLRLFGK